MPRGSYEALLEPGGVTPERLPKPLTMKRLLERVRAYLDGGPR